MGSITDVRSGLKTRFETIAGLKGYAVAPATPIVPCAFPLPAAIEYDEAMARGSDQLTFTLVLLLAKYSTEMDQSKLDAYLAGSGAASIKAAVEGDGTLGGACDWVRVARVTAYGQIEYNGVDYLGARLTAEVDVDGA